MAVIAISRQSGSLGRELANYLADKLGCKVITREYALDNYFGELSAEARSRLEESAKFYLCPSEKDSSKTYKELLLENLTKEVSVTISNKENLIILGLGAGIILRHNPSVISIRVSATDSTRIDRISRRFNISKEEAESIQKIGDRKHKRFVSTLLDEDISKTELFDLTINTDYLSVEECSDAVLALVSKHDKRTEIEVQAREAGAINHQTESPVFKNKTEEEFARILDMYGIEWMYEPKTFPIEWDSEGNIRMAFSPDFYLPKFDLYLELTVMNQKYVTAKNRKMKKVRELYPGTNVRIVYKKDFEALVARLKQFGG